MVSEKFISHYFSVQNLRINQEEINLLHRYDKYPEIKINCFHSVILLKIKWKAFKWFHFEQSIG